MLIQRDLNRNRLISLLIWTVIITLMYYYANPQGVTVSHNLLGSLIFIHWAFVLGTSLFTIPLIFSIRKEVIVANKEILLMFQHAVIMIDDIPRKVIRYLGRILAVTFAYLSGNLILLIFVILAILSAMLSNYVTRRTYEDWI